MTPATARIPASGSPFSRASLVAYTILIVYASLYPFSGWQFDTLSTYLDQIKQWPHYLIRFDILVNVLGYIPFGALIVFSVYPRIPRWWAMCIAIIAGVTMSWAMESLQFFLPSRVTSLLDLTTNSLGALVGAIAGAILAPSLLTNGKIDEIKQRWFWRESSRELVILALWPLAQIYPQAFLFGHGQVLGPTAQWLESMLEIELGLNQWLLQHINLSAEKYLISEAIITACGCAGAVLFGLSLLNRHAPKFRLSLLLLAGGFAIKALASALMFGPDDAFLWLTPGAQGGIIIGVLILYGFSFTPVQAQKRLAGLLLLISFVLVNLIPSNPYFLSTMQTMSQGKMLNFYGAAQFLAVMWPLAAMWYLGKPLSTSRKP